MKLIYLLLVPLFCTLNITAKERNQSKSVTTQADSISDDQVEYRFALGVQLGTDIGGAIPFPFSNVPDVFNPYPKLSPSIGAKLTFPVTKKWTLGAEVTTTNDSMTIKTILYPASADLPKCQWILRCWKFLFISSTRSKIKKTVF